MEVIQIYVLYIIVLACHGLRPFDHLSRTQRFTQRRDGSPPVPKIMRRFSVPGQPSVILGAPKYPYHLPPAEPILPGHTLIRPAIGMLKSSVKFPHREHEAGSGVYGHIDNLGIKFDGKNDRVLYTGFRRLLPHPQFIPMRRNAFSNPFLYKGQHLQFISPHPRQKKKLKRHESNEKLYKILLILPAEKKNKNYNFNGQHIILVKKSRGTDVMDLFRIIKSLRRDQESKENVKEDKPNKLYVTGTANFGDFSLAETDDDNTPVNKTVMFWKTKDAFNHMKISQEAPEHYELIPPDTGDEQKKWWFYHQSDFENFEDDGSR